MKMKLILGAALLAGVCLGTQPDTAEAAGKWNTEKTVTVTGENAVFDAYLSNDGKESWIYKVKLDKPVKKLVFPEKINNLPVTRLGFGDELYEEDADWYYSIFGETLEPWHGCYGHGVNIKEIESISFPSTVTTIEGGSFSGLSALKKVKLPDGMKELESYSFSACTSLKEVKLPAKLENFNTVAFKKSRKIKKLSISSKSKTFQTKNGLLIKKDKKSLVWITPVLKTVTIPKGVKEIADFGLAGTKAKKVVIPKSIRKIGFSALTGKDIEKIELKMGNKVYKMDGSSIYNKSNGQLAAVLVKNGRVKISSKVKILGEGTSVMGGHIARVDIPKSVKKVIEEWMFFESILTKVYFHGKKPPVIKSKYSGQVFTALPIFNEVYVPKGAKKTYIRWAKDRDGLKWDRLKTF